MLINSNIAEGIMNIETLEWVVTGVIIILQLYNFSKTKRHIYQYGRAIPVTAALRISPVTVNMQDTLGDDATDQRRDEYSEKVLEDIDYQVETSNEVVENREQEPVKDLASGIGIEVVDLECLKNHHFASIISSVNKYLLRNGSSTADFNLIRDIVDRHTSAAEEEINLTVATPLYLGLIGTMLGIIIGLFTMSNVGQTTVDLNPDNLSSTSNVVSTLDSSYIDSQRLDNNINNLIGGVKIAMLASLCGLGLTIFNSAYSFKSAKSNLEKRKSQLYTYLQIELLPIIGQSLAGTFESLQRNLLKFNDDMSRNLRQLHGVYDHNIAAISAQRELLESIDRAKVSEIAKYNINVLQQLNVSVREFEKFNGYVANVNMFVENARALSDKINMVLERTDGFQTLADTIETNIDNSHEIMRFLAGHLQALEEYKRVTNTNVATVGHSITDTFVELKEHIHASSSAIKRFTVEEIEALRQALSESKTNLSNLEHLATLRKDVALLKDASKHGTEQLITTINEVHQSMNRTNELLDQLKKNTIVYKWSNAISKVTGKSNFKQQSQG